MNENTEDLNTIDKLGEAEFEGPDACLMISLFEYGLAWKKDGDEILFIYGIKVSYKGDYTHFDRCTIGIETDPITEWRWAHWDEIASYAGRDEFYPKDYPLEEVVRDLLSYYGHENVFGSSYWEGFSIEGDDQHDNQQED